MKRDILIVLFGLYILVFGGYNAIQDSAEKTFLPGMHYVVGNKDDDIREIGMENLFPLYHYVDENAPKDAQVEDTLTYEMLLSMQAEDEESESEDLAEVSQNAVEKQMSSANISMEKLQDFNYLLSKFYTVDSTTTIGSDQLNIEDLMKYDMHIDKNNKGPKVLIFHTHSQETFADSVKGDANTSIVGIGKYLATKLNEKGIETLHHAGVYDLVNGKLDRSNAYQLAEAGVKEILNQNPSIEVVIDLHRDGVPEDKRLVTTVDGKQTAKIMYFNGLSRTKTNGDIKYLYNPYIDENLSFSFQMQLATEQRYPGFARKIYLKGYRYSLHMMPKSLLIEAGAQTNTVQEMKNAMDLLANVLYEVVL